MLSLFAFLVGLSIGSFLNVCIYRLPRRESIVFPGSHCPDCHKAIAFYDNIPLASFLLLAGRCRFCRTSISWRYPLVEAVNGIGYLFVLRQFGASPVAIVYALFFSSLLVITFIDLSHQIIPDVITLPGIVMGLIASATLLPVGLTDALVGLFLGGGLFYGIAALSLIILKKEGMGGGDIKFIAMIGAFLGWRGGLLTIFLASLTGSLVGLLLIFIQGRRRVERIPFGPFLAAGALIVLFLQERILHLYAAWHGL